MVTVEALKLLYKKLGGSADVTQITAISDMVDLIEDVANSGGGGGGGGMTVTVTWDGENAALDKNYTEIMESLNAGIAPVLLSNYEGMMYSYVLVAAYNETDSYSVVLGMLNGNSSGVEIIPFEFTASSATGTLTYTAK